MFLYFITKWEILTKNLVTFKRRDKVKGEKIVGVHWKIQCLGSFMKNQYIGGELPKKRGLHSLQI